MNISLEKKELIQAVATVVRFSERKTSTLPALAGIAISAKKDSIHFSATNLETGINLKVEGSVKISGDIVLPAAVFRDITNSFSGTGTVSLELDGDVVKISSGSAKTTMKTLPKDDFPSLPSLETPKTTLTLPGTLLKGLISSVGSCASPSTVRPELASIFLSAEGGSLKGVATDSFRLAEKKVSVNGSVKPFSMLIPAKNALDIAQTLPDEDINVAADEHQCSFSWKAGTATTRLVSAQYPDYEQIIPKKFAAEATVLKKDFETALRRASVFSDAFQKVRLGFGTKQVSLASRNSDVGGSEENIPAAASGEAIELPFNHRYLGAPLSLIPAESITLSAAGIGRPLVMRGQGDASFLYLVMPMNQ